jgi:hypothetical protein
MNYFAIFIIIAFIGAAVVEAINHRPVTTQIYLASAWLNIVFLYIK